MYSKKFHMSLADLELFVVIDHLEKEYASNISHNVTSFQKHQNESIFPTIHIDE